MRLPSPRDARAVSPALARRQLLAFAAAASSLVFVPPHAVADANSARVAQQQAELAEARRQQLVDPYSEIRSQRAIYADELPPLSPDERRVRAQAAAKAAANPRDAAKVSGSAPMPAASSGRTSQSDEYTVDFDPSRPIGLKLKDLRVGFEYGTTEGTSRVLVQDVTPGGQADASGKVAIDNIVVAVDGVNVERESAKQVTARLAKAKADGRERTSVTFKDALAFNERLRASPEVAGEDRKAPVRTTIAPASGEQEAQVLGVRRIEESEGCRRKASDGDLLEIRYAGRLPDGTVFDGMQLADRRGDDSIQFVLGKQPAGQFPPSWDVGLQGMCVGERREIDVPPALGYGPTGLVKKGVQVVPPNSRLLYDVELLAINALATP